MLTLEPIKEVSMTTGTKMGTQHISGSTCVNSPTSTLANNFAASLSLKSPIAHYLSNRKKPEKRLQSAMHLRSTHCGLNSVLDGTPSPVMNLGTKAAKISQDILWQQCPQSKYDDGCPCCSYYSQKESKVSR